MNIDFEVSSTFEARQQWRSLSNLQRADLISTIKNNTEKYAEEWVRISCEIKKIDPHSQTAGEEWINGPSALLRYLRLLSENLRSPKKLSVRDSQSSISKHTVFPVNAWEKLLLAQTRAEIWSKNTTVKQKISEASDGVALVLGAGNVSSIAPCDVLHQLLVENQTTILKMNPLNDKLGPIFEKILEPLIQRKFLSLVYGGGEIGERLISSSKVTRVHMTGSIETFDAIVWGKKEEQEKRKKNNSPLIHKEVTAELGCVTPILIVPGEWTSKEISFQAQSVASMLTNNAGNNCAAAKIIITSQLWPQREVFLKELENELSRTPLRNLYYPGTQKRYDDFCSRYPSAKSLGKGSHPEEKKWVLVNNISTQPQELALKTESFCGVLAEVALPCENAEAFLKDSVTFANDSIFGTLSCVILIDSRTQKKFYKNLQQAIADLKYGGIAINAWSGVLYWLMSTTWGAYPGHTREAVGSGIGVVHNVYNVTHPLKSVISMPFTQYPKPSWFTNHRNLKNLGKSLAAFEADPSIIRLFRLVVAALRG